MPRHEQYHARQTGIVDPLEIAAYRYTFIGVGTVGSLTARVFSQLGARDFRLIDPDVVSLENVGGQFYRAADVDRPKVEACRDNLVYFLPHLSIDTTPKPYNGEPLDGIVVAGVDSMEARSKIWSNVRNNPDVPLFVDGRTAGEQVHAYAIRPYVPADVEFYDSRLVPDSAAAALPCAEQGAPHAHGFLANLLANQVVRWIRGELQPGLVILFFQTMHLTTVSTGGDNEHSKCGDA